METMKSESRVSVMFFMKCLLIAYILTGALLVFLAFLLYKTGIGSTAVSISIIAIYAVSTLAAGFVAGKRMTTRKYMWGLVTGLLYFAVWVLMSLLVNHSMATFGNSFFTTLIICAAGGMLGGMLA